MRKSFRKTGAVVLGLAVVAALGGLIPSQAATIYSLGVFAKGALPQDDGTSVVVSKISDKDPNVDGDAATPGVQPATLVSTTVKLTYTLLPNGAPTSLTIGPFDPGPAANKTQTFTIAGPLLTGDYSVLVEQFNDAATPALVARSLSAFSIRIPATLTLTVENETVSPPYFGGQRVFALLKDANGAPIIGQFVTLNTNGGIVPQPYQQVGKYTGGNGVASFGMDGGATLMPGSYESTAKVLQSYTVDPLSEQVISQTYLSGSVTWNVLVAA